MFRKISFHHVDAFRGGFLCRRLVEKSQIGLSFPAIGLPARGCHPRIRRQGDRQVDTTVSDLIYWGNKAGGGVTVERNTGITVEREMFGAVETYGLVG